jgi:hypothetical protein
MSDLNPASVPNDPSCKPHREGSDNGYLGWQGVETSCKLRPTAAISEAPAHASLPGKIVRLIGVLVFPADHAALLAIR